MTRWPARGACRARWPSGPAPAPEPQLVGPRQLLFDDDPRHHRRWRTVMAPRHKAVDRVARPLEHRLDPAIVEVADPAGELGGSRLAPARLPEPHALDATGDDHPHPAHAGQRLAVASSRYSANLALAAVRRVGMCSVGTATG